MESSTSSSLHEGLKENKTKKITREEEIDSRTESIYLELVVLVSRFCPSPFPVLPPFHVGVLRVLSSSFPFLWSRRFHAKCGLFSNTVLHLLAFIVNIQTPWRGKKHNCDGRCDIYRDVMDNFFFSPSIFTFIHLHHSIIFMCLFFIFIGLII